MRTPHAVVSVVVVPLAMVAIAIATAGPTTTRVKSVATAPKIDPANFQATVDNPYFPLTPGTKLAYREMLGGRVTDDEMTVLADTRQIQGVTCTIVHDVARIGDRITEDTMDWYAQDRQGNVWYFGEDTKEYFPHGRVDSKGSWEAGVQGAQAGIIMRANPAVGAPYRQEYRRGVAEDMGQVVAVDETVVVPQGTFSGCVKTKDWSMLEAGHEFKWYAKGVGFVRSESTSKEVAVLASTTRP